MGYKPRTKGCFKMAKITIAGDAIVVTSAKKLEDIKAVEKYRPKALCIYDTDEEGHKVEAFRVGIAKEKGSINKYGASFGSATHDGAALATITIDIPKGTTDAKAYAAELIGTAINNLEKVEAQIAPALEEVAAEKAAVLAKITMA